MSSSVTFEAEVPIPQLSTTVYVSVPFYYRLPRQRSLGRSLSDDVDWWNTPRSVVYGYIEEYLGRMIGADGQQCLLRAMCEASATPLHDEGIIGDAVTFLLTSNYVNEEKDERFEKYFEAQAKGQVKIVKNILGFSN